METLSAISPLKKKGEARARSAPMGGFFSEVSLRDSLRVSINVTELRVRSSCLLPDRIWVKIPGGGFVGVGIVTGRAMREGDLDLRDAKGNRVDATQVLTCGTYHRENKSNPDDAEWFVPVRWLETVPIERAVQEVGMFGNQNTVCRPTTPLWRTTVERLKQRFTAWNK